jgi:predicted negative regulator of RcsB-dependent stress response
MASVRTLKKNVNYVLGDIISEVIWIGNNSEAGEQIVQEAFVAYDELISRINAKDVENKKSHFSKINEDFKNIANQLVDKVNAL